MISLSINIAFGRIPEDEPTPDAEPEELLPGGTSGSAQVEDAGYRSKPAMWTGTGFCLPEAHDPGPEGPY